MCVLEPVWKIDLSGVSDVLLASRPHDRAEVDPGSAFRASPGTRHPFRAIVVEGGCLRRVPSYLLKRLKEIFRMCWCVEFGGENALQRYMLICGWNAGGNPFKVFLTVVLSADPDVRRID